MPTGQVRGQHAMQCALGRSQTVLAAGRIEPRHDLTKRGDIIARKTQAPAPAILHGYMAQRGETGGKTCVMTARHRANAPLRDLHGRIESGAISDDDAVAAHPRYAPHGCS